MDILKNVFSNEVRKAKGIESLCLLTGEITKEG